MDIPFTHIPHTQRPSLRHRLRIVYTTAPAKYVKCGKLAKGCGRRPSREWSSAMWSETILKRRLRRAQKRSHREEILCAWTSILRLDLRLHGE